MLIYRSILLWEGVWLMIFLRSSSPDLSSLLVVSLWCNNLMVKNASSRPSVMTGRAKRTTMRFMRTTTRMTRMMKMRRTRSNKQSWNLDGTTLVKNFQKGYPRKKVFVTNTSLNLSSQQILTWVKTTRITPVTSHLLAIMVIIMLIPLPPRQERPHYYPRLLCRHSSIIV